MSYCDSIKKKNKLLNNKTKTCFFFFPFGGSVLCSTCVCKHSFDSSSQMKRTMCHTSKEIIQPNSVRTQSPHLGQLGSNRKQVIHLFCFLRSHENICFIQKLNTVTVCYNFSFLFFFFCFHTGELKHDYKASEKRINEEVLDRYSSRGLIIIHVQHLAKNNRHPSAK